MVKTSIYLPDELKTSLEETARREQRSEAELIREAIRRLVEAAPPRPRIPLVAEGLGDPTAAERVDELLRDFGG